MQNINIVPNTLREPEDTEKVPRDMVISYPGEVVRIKMTFDKPGRYVWHCHILSHEDHDMMRPMYVGKYHKESVRQIQKGVRPRWMNYMHNLFK
jgi:hypothetical protein